MKPATSSDSIPSKATITTSKNVAVFRQIPFFDSVDEMYTYVPTTGYGYVVVSIENQKGNVSVLHAWRVSRPRAIHLSWGAEKRVLHSKLDLDVMEGILNSSRCKVKDIG